jgi:DNA-binding CsgD family transcriptional regulator
MHCCGHPPAGAGRKTTTCPARALRSGKRGEPFGERSKAFALQAAVQLSAGALSRQGDPPGELEVLAALARGRSNRQIARALQISEETVKAHVSSILAKLGLADRTQAAIFGLQQRLVPLDQALDEEKKQEPTRTVANHVSCPPLAPRGRGS